MSREFIIIVSDRRSFSSILFGRPKYRVSIFDNRRVLRAPIQTLLSASLRKHVDIPIDIRAFFAELIASDYHVLFARRIFHESHTHTHTRARARSSYRNEAISAPALFRWSRINPKSIAECRDRNRDDERNGAEDQRLQRLARFARH